jgi:hypothetical protein
MSQTEQLGTEPEATPVGHTGIRVEIHEREAFSVNGWFGVLALAICIGIAIEIGMSDDRGYISIPIVIGVIILSSLVIVQPGQTRVVQFFGS